MTKDFLKRYRITLETEGPLFIGSGKKLTKKEWIYDRREKKGIILDERKLFEYLVEKDLIDSFESYMKEGRERLYSWICKNNISIADIKNLKKYELDCGELQSEAVEINLFVKDSYGHPYIPGSSLKGALRNVILAEMIRSNPYDNRGKIKKAVSTGYRSRSVFIESMKKESVSLEQHYFNVGENLIEDKSNMVNDIMRGIKISDSDPLNTSCLTVCQKIDKSINGKRKSQGVPVVRECIRPNTKIVMQLTIDKTCLGGQEITVAFIMNAVNNFLHEYNSKFLSHFDYERQYKRDIIYLGGGAGYHTKTVTNAVFADQRDRVRLTANIIDKASGGNHKHYEDINIGVSPRMVKCTKYDGKFQQMGPCRISIDEF